jgi:hypothetical protein
MALTVDIADLLAGAALQLLRGRRADGSDVRDILSRPAGWADLCAKKWRLVQAAKDALGGVRLGAADAAQAARVVRIIGRWVET